LKTETIYMELVGEGVAVWRPVDAERREDGLYRILSRPPDETETWKFPPGAVVRCKQKRFSGGTALVAFERIT
jgi:hypothetical protein